MDKKHLALMSLCIALFLGATVSSYAGIQAIIRTAPTQQVPISKQLKAPQIEIKQDKAPISNITTAPSKAGGGSGESAGKPEEKKEVLIAIGRVIWVQGSFKAVQPDKKERVLIKGALIFLRDTLITGPNSQAQIGFTDQTLMTFRADTKFFVNEYSYNAQPKKGSVGKYIMNLLQGGFRTITGLIAKTNPPDYQVNTPVATIGVRGTDYAAVLEDGQLQMAFYKGKPCVSNSSGSDCLSEDKPFMEVRSAKTAPKPLKQAPPALKTKLHIDQKPVAPITKAEAAKVGATNDTRTTTTNSTKSSGDTTAGETSTTNTSTSDSSASESTSGDSSSNTDTTSTDTSASGGGGGGGAETVDTSSNSSETTMTETTPTATNTETSDSAASNSSSSASESSATTSSTSGSNTNTSSTTTTGTTSGSTEARNSNFLEPLPTPSLSTTNSSSAINANLLQPLPEPGLTLTDFSPIIGIGSSIPSDSGSTESTSTVDSSSATAQTDSSSFEITGSSTSSTGSTTITGQSNTIEVAPASGSSETVSSFCITQ